MKKIFTIILLAVMMQNMHAQDTSKVNELITAYKKLDKFNGTVLVAAYGRIIFEKGYGYCNAAKGTRNNPQTIFQIASITKTFTSAVVLKLVQQHQLSLTDKLSKWYPKFPNAEKITIGHLLSHTSGIFDYTHEDTVTKVNTEQNMMAFLAKKPLDFQPGSDWRYSNSGYSILGFIIGKVSGIPYEQAVRKYIFKPLHMDHSGFDFEHLQNKEKATGYSMINDTIKTIAAYSDSSVVFAAGAIYSTAEDIYKWHRGLQSYQIVYKELLDKAYTPLKRNYGYGWIIDAVDNKKMVYHSGNIAGFSSVLVRIPQDDICIVLLNNQEGTELEPIARKILDILYQKPYEIPAKKTAISLPDAILQRYTGKYEITEIHLILEIILDNNQLTAHMVNGPAFPLTPEKENLFFIQDGKVEIEFVAGPSGKAEKLIINQNDQKKEGKRIQ
ncbi:MAG: hypothetical protein JWR09_5426 [Mucilaginibacter sp.]|nr:hypothetical protein [Mucilaginibacter sp.]